MNHQRQERSHVKGGKLKMTMNTISMKLLNNISYFIYKYISAHKKTIKYMTTNSKLTN